MIRPITRFDIPELIEIGKRMHAASKYSFIPFDERYTADLVSRYVGDLDRFAMRASSGFMFGYLRPFFFSQAKEAVDALWYVENNSRAALRLLRAFEEWGAAAGAANIRIESGAGIGDDADKILPRLGYAHLGGNFLKEV